MPTGDLDGRVVVVTGSTDGIGRAVARGAVLRGGSVVVNGRRASRVDEVVEELRQVGGSDATVLGVVGDVLEEDAIAGLTDDVARKLGGLDVLVNNVGGGASPHLEDASLESWDAVQDRNLRSVFRMCMAALPHLRSSSAGRIINVTSIAGRQWGRLSGPDYAAAKAGVHGLTRHLAHVLAPEGITVNAVAPGMVASERALSKFRLLSEEEQRLRLASTPMGRFGTPEEIAWAVLAFASPDAGFATGATLDVNGGAFLT